MRASYIPLRVCASGSPAPQPPPTPPPECQPARGPEQRPLRSVLSVLVLSAPRSACRVSLAGWGGEKWCLSAALRCSASISVLLRGPHLPGTPSHPPRQWPWVSGEPQAAPGLTVLWSQAVCISPAHRGREGDFRVGPWGCRNNCAQDTPHTGLGPGRRR